MANTVGSLLIRIGADISGLQKSLGKVERDMMRFSGKMQRIGSDLTRSVSIPLIGMGAAALKAFGDFEKLEKGMTTIMGSSEAAAAELKKLQKAAEAPGLGFEQAIAGSIRLQAVGFSADEARKTLQEFGNAIATTGGGAEDLDQVTRQLTQMISKNRIIQEDFMVLQERMPLVSQAMQKAFGHSNIELIRASGMSAKDFVARLTQELSTFDRVEGGFSNAFENMGIAVKTSMAQIGAAINKSLDVTGKMEAFAAWVQRAATWFDGLSDSQKKLIVTVAALAAAIGPLLYGISTMVKLAGTAVMGLKALLGAVSFLISPVGLIVAGIAALAAGFIYAYQKSEKFRATIQGVGAVVSEVVKIFGEAVSAFVRGFAELKEGEFKKAAKSFQEGLIKSNPIQMAVNQGERLSKAFTDGYAKSIQKSADEKAFDPYKDKEKILANAGAVGQQVGATFAQGVSDGALKNFKGLGDATLSTKEFYTGGGMNFAAQSTGGPNISGDLQGALDKLKQGSGITSTWMDNFNRMSDSVRNFAQEWSGAFNSINELISQAFENRSAAIDAAYSSELKRINGSRMSEEAKQKAIQKLEEDTDRKRRKLARQQAIREKALGIIQATIATAVAVAKNVANPILAAITAAAGAVQIALIASQKIPALAQGGLAYGPQLAMVGDNRNARVDPEVIAPLSKLEGMLGRSGTQRIIVEGRIAGKDILLSSERAEQDRLRTRGF